MIDLDQIKHHPAIDEIAEVICNLTQNTDRGFFNVEIAYFLAKMCASMRVVLSTKDRGEVPVNVYALALATSGSGKGYSVSILENQFLSGFRSRFMTDTFPVKADENLWSLANDRAARDGTEQQAEYDRYAKDFRNLGALAFTFDSGTVAAVKQMRQKLLMANAGSINLQMDEIGSNITSGENLQVMAAFLELYDQGQIKQKLTKNTNDNQRHEEIDGKTPTNFLGFGTPSKLLDGGQIEEAFYSLLETGYARRCIFGIGQKIRASDSLTPEQIYARLTDPQNDAVIQKWHDHFVNLADPSCFGRRIQVDDTVSIELLRYKIDCERMADQLPVHEEILKSEIEHRYFKVLKIAGAFAFIDESLELELDHLYAAMKLVEESGKSFLSILRREKNYVRLARYLAGCKSEQTHADLHEALGFYKTSSTARNEQMALAMAWGYKNAIVIKKTVADGIEFYQGETLEKTDLDKMILSYSNHVAYNYQGVRAPWDQLTTLVTQTDYHWSSHHFRGGHRSEENAIAGFNMIVVDVDGSASLDMTQKLLSDYCFMTYTTKRHGEEGQDRFRLLMPMKYRLVLPEDEYLEFMKNVVGWLPVKVDEKANQRSRKWRSNPAAIIHYNQGDLIDPLPFVPKTSKNEQYAQSFEKIANLDNLERWFLERMSAGNRNNNLIRFAMALVDSGAPLPEIESRVLTLNSQCSSPLTEDEIRSTILVTVAKKFQTP